jgi:hypothetical protein
LRKAPAFTLAAIATLTLGIGGNVAMFSVANTVLLKPLQVPAPERVVRFLTNASVRPSSVTPSSAVEPLMNYMVGGVRSSLNILAGSSRPADCPSRVRSMNDVVAESIGRTRFDMWLTTIFGGSALLLAAVGVYGLTAYCRRRLRTGPFRRPVLVQCGG